jgi:hypothetical protein
MIELGLPREGSGQNDGAAIKSVLGCDFEFFFGRQGLVVLQAGGGPIVGNNAEKTL